MKKSILVVSCCVLLFSSCKEKPPIINFGEAILKDTTFVLSAIPEPDPHSVLVEEFTGASCTNCPAAHETLKEIQKEHPGRVNVIGLYITGPLQTKPPKEAKYDFRHAQATEIANSSIYGGVNALPIAGIDRMSVNGSVKIEKGAWTSTINSRLSVQESINLKIESAYNTTSGMAAIRATIVYTKPVAFPHNLSIVVVEDSIIDAQEYPSTDPIHKGLDEEYDFTNVFRGMVTAGPFGDPVLAAITPKEAGRVLIRNYSYKVTGVFNPANCRVVAFVNSTNGGDYRILQSAQAKLK